MREDEKEVQRQEGLERRRESFLRDFFENSELYTFGIITQKGYKELEDRLSQHARSVSDRFHRWFIISLAAFAIIALSSAAGLVGFGILLKQQGEVTTTIQAQRRATIRGQCEDQNQRNFVTVSALNMAVDKAEKSAKTEQRKQRLRDNAQVSIGLINALAPHRDCEKVVEEATR